METLMRYLIRKKRAKVKHIWSDVFSDTACRMYSTGGLNKKRYKEVGASDLPECENCLRNMRLAKQGKGYRAKNKRHKFQKTYTQTQAKKKFKRSHTYHPEDRNQADIEASKFILLHGGW